MSAAARKATAAGYTRLDCYSPYPVGDAADAMNFPKSEMGPVMFIGGLTGACRVPDAVLGERLGLLAQRRRPAVLSWPSFIPITFEMMVLTTALTGLFGLLAICGLPRYHHPLFNSKAFDRASRDRFFLCIEAIDPEVRPGRDRVLPERAAPPVGRGGAGMTRPFMQNEKCKMQGTLFTFSF